MVYRSEQKQLLEAFIAMERAAGTLYQLFHASFPEDAEFWWQLVIEEENHAALLRAGREYFVEQGMVPDALFQATFDDLQQTIRAIREIIASHETTPFSRATALQTALALETMAGELDFQRMLEQQPDSPALQLFQTLNREDSDHARRIEAYMHQLDIA